MMLVLLIVAGVLLLAGFVVGLVFFILFLVKQLGGTTGGWRRLAEVHGTANPPTGQITNRETIQVGALTYKRCVTLGVANEGLYVTIWRKTALILWAEVEAVGQATLYWQKVPMLTVNLSFTPIQFGLRNLPLASANLLANAMSRPLTGGDGQRPRRVHLRDRPQWPELFPHLQQLGIEVASAGELPWFDEAVVEFTQKTRPRRAAGKAQDEDTIRDMLKRPFPEKTRTPLDAALDLMHSDRRTS
jgi:hypothetical protein